MHARFERRIEAELKKLQGSCGKRKQKAAAIERRAGRPLGQNSRAAARFGVDVIEIESRAARVSWKKVEQGIEIRKRCVSRPWPLQEILLQRLALRLPESVEIPDNTQKHGSM